MRDMTGQRWPQAMLAAAVALHAAMLVSLFTGYLNFLFDDASRFSRGIDFYGIYQGGTYALEGHTIYDWAVADTVPYSTPYRYLPFFAHTVGAAFNAIPARGAYWVWVVCIELMVAVNAWGALRFTDAGKWRYAGAACWYAFTPLYLEIYMGQWSILMATLTWWTGLLLVRGAPIRAAVPWVASLLVKTNSALLGPLWLRLGQWRMLAVAAVIIVLLNAPYFLFRPDDLDTFLRLNFGSYYGEEVRDRAVLTISGDLSGKAFVRAVWFAVDGQADHVPRLVERAYLVAIVGASLAATFLPRRVDVIALFSVWTCVFFLGYPAWEHHHVMMLPALTLLIVARPEYRTVALVVFVLCASPTPYALGELAAGDHPRDPLLSDENYWPAWASVLHHASKALPVAWLWAVLALSQLAPAWRSRVDKARPV